MGLSRTRSIALLVSVFVLSTLFAGPASAASKDPLWRSTADGGYLSHDIAQFVGASQVTFNNPPSFFVTGASAKPAALQAAGINDQDVVTTAFDAQTGAVRWTERFDDTLSRDAAASLEVNYNNNLLYVPINRNNDIVVVDYSIRNGDESKRRIYTGAQANDSAISGAGGFMSVVGSAGGDFLVLAYETGGEHPYLIEDRSTKGQANSADIMSTLAGGSEGLAAHRTLLVTGKESGFGTGGDIYTAAYNYRDGRKLWESRWASPDNRLDEGLVAGADWSKALGKGVGFVAGRTYSPATGFDTVVIAYDLKTGAQLWADRYDSASKDDSPVALDYSDDTSTLFVTGTTERGFPHGKDVMTLMYDVTTGERKSVVFAAGDSSNGEDTPTGIVATKDGRAFVSATLMNKFATGSEQIAMLAYDSYGNEIGRDIYGGGGSTWDRSAGVALGVGGRVLTGGSLLNGNNGYDFAASAFDSAAFEAVKEPVITDTTLEFTPGSTSSGQHSDSATLEVLLKDEHGAPMGGRNVTLQLHEKTASVTTDAQGLASATFELDMAAGTYATRASYQGEPDVYSPSEAVGSFEVLHEDSTLDLTVTGSGPNRVLRATLTDADSGRPLEGRTVDFYSDGGYLGSSTTDPDGTASFTPTGRDATGAHTYEARFEGDDRYLGSSDSVATTGGGSGGGSGGGDDDDSDDSDDDDSGSDDSDDSDD